MGSAALYIRVSSKRQAEKGASPEAQEAACRAHAKAQGWRVGKVYSDTETGRSADRPELTKLRQRLSRYAAVVVWKLDRAARSTVDLYHLVDECRAADCTLASVTESISVDTSVGRFTLGVLAVCAEFESNLISERVTATKAHLLGQRKLPWPAHYGFKRCDNGAAEVDEAEADVVRRIFTERSRRRFAREIADGLADDGITKRGEPWTAGKVTEALRDRAYLGEQRVATRTRAGAGWRTVSRDQWEYVDGVLPAIVTDAEWAAAHPDGLRGRRATSGALFRKLVVCGQCGRSVYAYTAQGFYRCRGRQGDGGCELPHLTEQQLADALHLALGNGNVKAELRSKHAAATALEQAEAKFARLQDAFEEGLLDKARLRRARAELSEAETLLSNNGGRPATKAELARARRLCRQAVAMDDAGAANERLRQVLSRVVVAAEGTDVVLWAE